jgi:hypothetical protein
LSINKIAYFPPAGGVPQRPLLIDISSRQRCEGVVDFERGTRVKVGQTRYGNGYGIDYDTTVGEIVLVPQVVPPNPNPGPTNVPFENTGSYIKYGYAAVLNIVNIPPGERPKFYIFTEPIFANNGFAGGQQYCVPWWTCSALQMGNTIKFLANYTPPLMSDGYTVSDDIPQEILVNFFIVKSYREGVAEPQAVAVEPPKLHKPFSVFLS